MEYWGVDDLYLEPCCVQRYYQQRELLNWDHQVKKEEEEEVFRPGPIGKFQKILWDLFEKPHTSLGARVSSLCDCYRLRPRFLPLGHPFVEAWKQVLKVQ